MKEILTDMDRLRKIALDQHGYVTRAQAIGAGVSSPSLTSLSHRGRVDRVAQGVYRVPLVPETEEDRLQLALLKTGREDAALSHETALDVYEVCDIFPAETHVVVPRSARVRRSGLESIIIHHEDLPATDIGWHDGMRTVTLSVAVGQCVRYGTPGYLLRQAMREGGEKGLLTTRRVEELETMLDEREAQQKSR